MKQIISNDMSIVHRRDPVRLLCPTTRLCQRLFPLAIPDKQRLFHKRISQTGTLRQLTQPQAADLSASTLVQRFWGTDPSDNRALNRVEERLTKSVTVMTDGERGWCGAVLGDIVTDSQSTGRIALHYACANGEAACVQALLLAGSKVHTPALLRAQRPPLGATASAPLARSLLAPVLHNLPSFHHS